MLICFARATIFFISTTEIWEQQQQQHHTAQAMASERACLINGMQTSNMKMIFSGIIAMYFLKNSLFWCRHFSNCKKQENIFAEFIGVQSVCWYNFAVHCLFATCIRICPSSLSSSVLSQVICICHKWHCLEFSQRMFIKWYVHI